MARSTQQCFLPTVSSFGDPHTVGSLFLALVFVVSLSGTLLSQDKQPTAGQDVSSAAIVIPDGTPVQLRFAQAVWAYPISPFISDPPRSPFRKGDTVRIIAAADVEVNSHLVIRKGSIGQATITNITWRDPKHPNTSIVLRLDWINSLSGQQVPLRPGMKGKPKSILLTVLADHGGFLVDQTSLMRGVFQAMTFQDQLKSMHEKLWVPVGTRMTSFVHGAISLDPKQLANAEALLPLPNTTALITVYRSKGQKDQKPGVHCDGKQLVSLSSRQFFQIELTAGAHEFFTDRSNSLQLEFSSGKEYYLYLKWHELTGAWKLESVTIPEGEDGVADGEMISVSPT